ncbi:hypothetical protein QE418_003383 [Microbacterium testaceum]|uniref:hypothetical protein n=1 Tax=Microbacterium TaxID=33882 RepID=UPI002786E605|nr:MULTISPECIES: hypothetical protein [Microbacterium]MDQ1113935.1 hypothetical protein [Microbacterium testaceum]MDR6098958.1 hypothetical protein [Microbacterium sp. SORGH_AS_0454]
MSRRILGRTHVLVEERITTRDDGGGRITERIIGPRRRVKCSTVPVREWSAAEEQEMLGLQIVDMLVLLATDWPGDVKSLVIKDGQTYETVGAPQHFELGRRTSHWRVTLRWLGEDRW